MKQTLYALSMCFLCSAGISSLKAQDKKPETPAPPPTPTVVTLSGYVRADYFYDTRQTVNAREGHVVFVPASIRKDANSKDINASPQNQYVGNSVAPESRRNRS